jgi:hypothetical protein
MKYRGIEIARVEQIRRNRRRSQHGLRDVMEVWWVVYAGTEQERAFSKLAYVKAQIDIDLGREA